MARSSLAAIRGPDRKAVDEVVLHLPMPPSTNDLWRPVRSGMALTDSYRNWRRSAGWALVAQRPGRIEGRYRIHIRVARADTRCDLTNILKAAEDLMQAHNVIDNDRLCERAELEWDDTPTAAGVTVLLVTAGSPVGAALKPGAAAEIADGAVTVIERVCR